MKAILPSLLIPIIVCIQSFPAAAADTPTEAPGILALIEVYAWGASTWKPGGYHAGFLHVKTVEPKGQQLPSEFKLSFKRKASGGEGSTVWNQLPSYSDGRLMIYNDEWLVGYFKESGETWTAVPGGELVELARPEDLPPEQLRMVQAEFTTPLTRTWVPEVDVLEPIMARTRWGMSVEEFRKVFEDAHVSADNWKLDWSSFRNELVVSYPNTKVVFEFSGVVDTESTDHVPVSSSLIGFSIKHPQKRKPYTGSLGPRENPHYQYLKKLHDAYVARLEDGGVKYEQENMFHPGTHWQRCTTQEHGVLAFVYSGPFGHEGVFAQAPRELIAEDLRREREAAAKKTRDWPHEICGEFEREPPEIPDFQLPPNR